MYNYVHSWYYRLAAMQKQGLQQWNTRRVKCDRHEHYTKTHTTTAAATTINTTTTTTSTNSDRYNLS